MGAAVPVIGSLEGEAQLIIERAEAGICVEPENPHAMAEAILRLCDSGSLCRTLGENGRRFARRNFNRLEITEKLDGMLALAKTGIYRNYQEAAISGISTHGSSFIEQSATSSNAPQPEIE